MQGYEPTVPLWVCECCYVALVNGDGCQCHEDQPECPVCAEPPDYCQGHGEIGDPDGFRIMEKHEDGEHDECRDTQHPAGLCGRLSPRAVPGADVHECYTKHLDYPHSGGDLYGCEPCEDVMSGVLDLDDVLPMERPEECDCETRTFDTGQCAGCGSYLAGSREAVTDYIPTD